MGTNIQFEKIDDDESWRVFDDAARRHLGIDAVEFVRRWDSGAYAADDEISVMQVAMLRPSGR